MSIRCALLICAAMVLGLNLPARADQPLSLIFQDDFEKGGTHWKTTDVKDKFWKITEVEGNRVFRVTGQSDYRPPHRSPRSIAFIKDIVVGDFELTVKVQSTNTKAGGHRDMCLFLGYQNPARFYYVHLGQKADPYACQIFIVNDAARTKITTQGVSGIPWDEAWHNVKVIRRISDGTMEVYFDDMTKPVMKAKDKTFMWGQVGLGTFDDHGNWDDFELRGVKVSRK